MSDLAEGRRGYRGYVASRPFFGERVPQHVQNLVIRDYATRQGLPYLLSATEYAMPGCTMMLQQALRELGRIEGLIAYSLFMMPERRERRLAVYRQVLDAGASLHFAVEGLSLNSEDELGRLEDIYRVRQCLPACHDGAMPAATLASS